MAVRPFEEQPHGLHRKCNPKLVLKGKRIICILCQETPTRPPSGDTKKSPFSSWIENIISLYILYLELYSLFFLTPCKKSGIFPSCLDHAEIWQHEILCKPTNLGAVIFSSNTKLWNRD